MPHWWHIYIYQMFFLWEALYCCDRFPTTGHSLHGPLTRLRLPSSVCYAKTIKVIAHASILSILVACCPSS